MAESILNSDKERVAVTMAKDATDIIHPGATDAIAALGGKAAALSALETADLPIPPWFVVTPDAFTASLSNTQRSALEAACAQGDNAAIEQIFAEVMLDVRVVAQLTGILDRLCPKREAVAVRSSAIDEDGALHSFAGQFDSFLFVPPERVTARIIAVWRSGFSERALAYRREHGLNTTITPPAVLVQRMVNADAAGVAFSADPVSGRRSVAIVSALYGLGTALVSGECDADTYSVDHTGKILSHTVARKTTAHRPYGDEGIYAVPVSPELVAAPVLDDGQIRAVAELARRCEQHFGSPQDIEWAIAGDTLYLLQSRPITSLVRSADPDGCYALWDNSNIAESYNGVTTPLTFSFASYAYEQVYRQLCRMLGIPENLIVQHSDTFRHMLGLINGRIYYNLLNWYRLLSLMPGFTANRKFMEQMMGVKEGLPESIVAELERAGWSDRLRDRLRFLSTLCTMLASYRRLPRDIEAFYARVERALTTGAVPLERQRADELVATYRSLERQLITRWDAPLVNDLFTMIFYGVLRGLVTKWCGDETGSLQNDLLSGEGGIISAEPARRVKRMAEIAAAHSELVESLCCAPLPTIRRDMTAVPVFVAEYRAYLDKFADRCLEELKLESSTLREDPLPLLRSIGHMARRLQEHADEQGTDTRTPDAKATPRQMAERRVSAMLRGHPLRRMIFGWVVRHARARVRDRENQRFERTRVFGQVRRIFSELGRRFYALDLLDDPRDIFYLEVEEALGFVSGTATTTDLKGLVAVRKAEYARFQTLSPPSNRFETRGIVNHGNTFRAPTRIDAGQSGGETRKGLGCCPGIVRGPVRVITDPRGAEIKTGEILVAQRTDPGWIMLFPAAAGVLVEYGSLLSHSAIVAREMGIPTIVSLTDVTTWLQTGDWVEFDGSTGVVRKINPQEART